MKTRHIAEWVNLNWLWLPYINHLNGTVAYADNPSDVFKHRAGITKEQMEQGRRLGGPLFDLIGVAAGVIFSFVVAWQLLQTSVDLLYLYVPVLRGFLAPEPNNQNPSVFARMTTISDDMQKALELNGSNMAQTNMGAGAMSGMDGGMGGMGMGMGGMGMGGANPQMGNAPVNKRNTAVTYFKNRAVSLILLMVCIGVLASSVLTDSGINIAELIMKVIAFFNRSAEEQFGATILFFIR